MHTTISHDIQKTSYKHVLLHARAHTVTCFEGRVRNKTVQVEETLYVHMRNYIFKSFCLEKYIPFSKDNLSRRWPLPKQNARTTGKNENREILYNFIPLLQSLPETTGKDCCIGK